MRRREGSELPLRGAICMATERKPFCRIETSLLREPWPDDLKLALVKLVMFMCDRWARDRLTTGEAIRATLNKAQVAEISGKHRPDVASTLLERLADVASISIERQGDFTSIYWPKLAETQGWASRDRAISARKQPQSAPAPAPAPAHAQKKGQEKAASPPTRTKSSQKRKTQCPEELDAEQWARVFAWRDREHPKKFWDAELQAQWKLCRDHHIGKGNLWVDWVRAFYSWLTGPFYKQATTSDTVTRAVPLYVGGEKPPDPLTEEENETVMTDQKALRDSMPNLRRRLSN